MWALTSKYVFKGALEMKTALHVGGGKENYTSSDKPIVRTPDGYPFIPGSSFKGAFRGAVERLAPSIPGIISCQLIDEREACPTVRKDFPKQKENMKEDDLVAELEYELCCTCKLFGSPWSISKIFFQDMKMAVPSTLTQVRDGVMIDRDSERAVDQLKYDFETVPPESRFEMEIALENPTRVDLGLTCVGLNEFLSETMFLGGMKTRGLGACKLKDLKIYKLDLEGDGKEERLKNYLIHDRLEEKMEEVASARQFIQTWIEQLF